MASFDMKLELLTLKLFDMGVLKFGNYKMKVGADSPVYFDIRIIVSYPEVMKELCDIIAEFILLKKIVPKIFCGVPYTALPIASVLSVDMSVPMVVRRKERKSYGTMKLIEGKFSPGDECVIIEDVVTTGSSILETVEDLKNDGLVVKEAMVVLDRQQGGTQNLLMHDVTMHSLLDFTKVLDILLRNNKIDKPLADKVHTYLVTHQISPTGDLLTKKLRYKMKYTERSEEAHCLKAKDLFDLMEQKQTNLCVAVDVTTGAELLDMVEKVGQHCCLIKTHSDAISDWSTSFENSLIELSKKHNFFIMEDRKLGDIGNTVLLQCKSVFRWADFITMHSVAGMGSLMGAAEAVSHFAPKAIFLVAQLSTKGNLITPQYTKGTVDLARSQSGMIAGLVCQSPDVFTDPGLIQLTPGVAINSGGDNFGQTYSEPTDVISKKWGDIAVIGRAITKAADPASEALKLRQSLWQAYLERITS